VTYQDAACLTCRFQLFGCPYFGHRELQTISRARHLTLVPFLQPFIHAYSLSSSTTPQIRASVVSMREAIEAAFCNAVRATLVGSTTPAFTKSSNCSVAALNP
jgi:hypothetical protein